MIDGYERLHEFGYAHSVEAWREGELVGGIDPDDPAPETRRLGEARRLSERGFAEG